MDITIKAPASVPEGTYPAVFSGLDEKTSREGVPFWRWEFALRTAGGELTVSGASSTNTGPKAKSYKWLTSLLGRKPQPGEVLGTNLSGRPCLLVLAQDEQGYNDVADVLPPARLPGAAVHQDVSPSDDDAPSPDEPPAYGELPF